MWLMIRMLVPGASRWTDGPVLGMSGWPGHTPQLHAPRCRHRPKLVHPSTAQKTARVVARPGAEEQDVPLLHADPALLSASNICGVAGSSGRLAQTSDTPRADELLQWNGFDGTRRRDEMEGRVHVGSDVIGEHQNARGKPWTEA